MYTCGIAVVQQCDVGGESVQDVYLVYAEGCTRIGNHILYAALVHRQDVGVSLHHKHAVFLGYGFLCLVDAVELAVFVVDFRVGRVDVLLVYSFGARVEQTAAKSHNLSADANPREYHTSGISVYQLAPVVLVADACLQYKLFLVSLSQSLGGKGTAVL